MMPRIDYDEVYDRQGKLLSRVERVVSDPEIYRETVGNNLLSGPLGTVTPDQADAWIDANVTTLAGARTALRTLARLVIALRDTR